MSGRRASSEGHHEPGLYEIRVKGHLDDRWSHWFESMTITREEDGDTLLTGPVVDQAALHGLLRKVRDLGLPLLSVNRVEAGPSTTLGTGQADAADVEQQSEGR
jgi:hypothetical protein